MPYQSNQDLPLSVRSHMPGAAQNIYRSAFNRAWDNYRGKEPERIEEIAHRIAWFAVKKSYRKAGDLWIKRQAIVEYDRIPGKDGV
jgi:cation transport regulator